MEADVVTGVPESGLTAAVGFAIYENIMYVAMYGMQTAIVRAFTAIPLHAFCGAFMGAIYSYSKKASILGNGGASVMYTILALLVPMAIHGTYDTFVSRIASRTTHTSDSTAAIQIQSSIRLYDSQLAYSSSVYHI